MAVAEASSSNKSIPIPKAEFIEDVATFMEGKDVDKVIAKLNEDLRTLRMVEHELLQKRVRLINKLPELQKALDIITELIAKQATGEAVVSDFLLADGVYAKAKMKDVKTVNLWLGANVMLEYSLAEAQTLLDTNVKNCSANLKSNEENVAFIKDSITTTEVSISRIWNHDVERRRKLKEEGGGEEE